MTPDPESQPYNRHQEHDPKDQLDPEDDGSVKHIEDLERHEEDYEEQSYRCQVGRFDNAVEHREESFLDYGGRADDGTVGAWEVAVGV